MLNRTLIAWRLSSTRGTEDGLATNTLEFLNHHIRPSTSKFYGYRWRVFVNWCYNNQLDLKIYWPKKVLKFLVDHSHLSDQYLNVIRSAISSVYNKLYPQWLVIYQHPLILKYFKTKRKLNNRVPELHDIEARNLRLLIDLIKTLQQKTLLLLGVATIRQLPK